MDDYAMLRSSIPSCSFLQEVAGSDKRYSFSFPPTESSKLYVTESAIDALSLYVLRNRAPDNYLSIGGAVVPQQTDRLPAALDHFLSMYPQIETVCLCLDNDKTGIPVVWAALIVAPFLSQGLKGIIEGFTIGMREPLFQDGRSIWACVLFEGLRLVHQGQLRYGLMFPLPQSVLFRGHYSRPYG